MEATNGPHQLTQQEKEYLSLPICKYDPLGMSRCESRIKIDREHCERCIVNGLANELMNGCESEVMRWFIAYKNFRDAMEKIQINGVH